MYVYVLENLHKSINIIRESTRARARGKIRRLESCASVCMLVGGGGRDGRKLCGVVKYLN